MHTDIILLLSALTVFGYGLLSAGAEKRAVTPAAAAIAIGAAVGFGFEAAGVGTAAERRTLLDGGGLALLAELALAIILFVDAATLRLPTLRREAAVPLRLLGLGLPLLVFVGWVAALPLWPAIGALPLLMLALMLAPTDAALSQPIFHRRDTPRMLRDGINVESGLNDGLVLPVFLAVVAGLDAGERGLAGWDWLGSAALAIAVGAAAGAALGWLGGRLASLAAGAKRMEPQFERLIGIALAVVAYAAGEIAGGNGFVATFVAGLAVTLGRPDLEQRMEAFGEAEATLLAMLTFLAFGALVLPVAVTHWDARAVLYAVGTLVLLRPLVVWVALAGTGLRPAEKLFAGWFGPRGIASVLYMLLAVRTLTWEAQPYVFSVVALTVTMSVAAHGATARPASRSLARRLPQRKEEP